ncbi:MAG: hypothetical protein RLZ98_206 [Pseudomonadota bacterium]|jgi:nucleoside-diphosphate-sugar epimerase
MKILVTGANGFVGRVLCRRLAGEGREVVAAVRDGSSLASGERVAVREIGSIGAGTDWRGVLEECDAVIHLAARVHLPGKSGADLALARAVNRDGTAKLAFQAAAAGVRRFVLCSTVKVLGEGKAEAYTEEDAPAPGDAYAISKLEGELALTEITGRHGMSFTIIRPPLVYGPGVGANFLHLMRAVEKGIPLPLGLIRNRRSMIYVENLADVLALAAVHPVAADQMFLVADAEPLSTPDLVAAIADAGNWPIRLVPVPTCVLQAGARAARQGRRFDSIAGSLWVDQSRIAEMLGWRPNIPTMEGIIETVRWEQGKLRAGSRGKTK